MSSTYRVCTRCKHRSDPSEFSKQNGPGYYKMCRTCRLVCYVLFTMNVLFVNMFSVKPQPVVNLLFKNLILTDHLQPPPVVDPLFRHLILIDHLRQNVPVFLMINCLHNSHLLLLFGRHHHFCLLQQKFIVIPERLWFHLHFCLPFPLLSLLSRPDLWDIKIKGFLATIMVLTMIILMTPLIYTIRCYEMKLKQERHKQE